MAEDNFLYNSVVMAKYIVAYANKFGYAINMTKLQKLLYIAYGTCISVKNQRLVNEHPQAWPFGPVFPTTRNKLLKISFEDIDMNDESLSEIKKDKEIESLVRIVFGSYGMHSASALSEWSHKKDSPWYRTTKSDGFYWGATIPDEFIKDYFNRLITYKS